MKTKTENKNKITFKATFLRLTAIFISIVLLSFTVSAQDFWNTVLTHNSINEIASVLVEAPAVENEAAPTSLLSSTEVTISLPLYESIEQETLETEDWMFDNSYFNKVELEEINEMEQPLDLEPWMQDENYFDNEAEGKLELETWMTNESLWG